MNYYLGHNLNISHGFLSVIDHADQCGYNFFQIFLSSPQDYKYNKRPNTDLVQFKNNLTQKNMKVVVHASYMLNFCNDPASFIYNKAIETLVKTLDDSHTIGAIGAIIHMGKRLNLDNDTAITNYVNGVKKTLELSNKESILILETGAGQGTETCTSLIDLGKLKKRFTETEQTRIKFCIDTCHIFSAGYNVGDVDYVDVLNQMIDLHLSWNNIACIHFNDSKTDLNKKKDQHADIGKGMIGIDGLKKFFLLCVEKNVPIVLETPCDELTKIEQNVLVKSWLNVI